LVAFTYPLFIGQLQRLDPNTAIASSSVRLADAPLIATVLLLVCLGALFLEMQGQAINAKVVAALGVLVAATAVLRFLETAIPGPGGFSPIFVPIILAGYVFGARFGFLMGALSLLASALITGGVGPWLPYQMLAAGWIGLTAGLLPKPGHKGAELTMLAVFSFAWGILFGVILNLYFWPFFSGEAALSWQPGVSVENALVRYGAFYLTTSFLWDMARSLGNVIFVLLLGLPIVRALTRFKDRYHFEMK
jgi:energy-coupling factor transport system substrate-specific component